MLRAAHRRCVAVAAAATVTVGVSACGLSSGVQPPASAPPGELVTQHVGARQMFRQMTHALHKIHSVSINMRIELNHGPPTLIDTEIQIPGRVEATVIHGGSVVNERWIGDSIYLRYNAVALMALTGDPYLAEAEHDRWIQLPDSTVPLAASMRHMATHQMLQECDILGPTGKLSVGGPSQTNGLASVTLHDHGDRPGTARRRIVLSANAPYLPLRIIQTRPARPGGTTESDCLNRKTRTTLDRAQEIARRFDQAHHIKLRSSNETITRYDQPLHLDRPPHPLTPRGSDASTANSVTV